MYPLLKLPDPDEVAYLYANSNYTYIYYRNGQRKLVSLTLKRLIDEVYSSFLRLHKCCAVHPACLKMISSTTVDDKKISAATIQVGEKTMTLPVSRRQAKQLNSVVSVPE